MTTPLRPGPFAFEENDDEPLVSHATKRESTFHHQVYTDFEAELLTKCAQTLGLSLDILLTPFDEAAGE